MCMYFVLPCGLTLYLFNSSVYVFSFLLVQSQLELFCIIISIWRCFGKYQKILKVFQRAELVDQCEKGWFLVWPGDPTRFCDVHKSKCYSERSPWTLIPTPDSLEPQWGSLLQFCNPLLNRILRTITRSIKLSWIKTLDTKTKLRALNLETYKERPCQKWSQVSQNVSPPRTSRDHRLISLISLKEEAKSDEAKCLHQSHIVM